MQEDTYQAPQALSASTLVGDKVKNRRGEVLGKVEEIMIDLHEGRVAYAVLSFGGFMGLGDKLFAVPWEVLEIDTINRQLIMNVEKERLKNAPGFAKEKWPGTGGAERDDLLEQVYEYYGCEPYWQKANGGQEQDEGEES
jgi:sporulation protein YlmC with PRC-barrel domain